MCKICLSIGVHGEAGAERTKVRHHEAHSLIIYTTLLLLRDCMQVQPADKVVERLISQIVSQEPGYQYFKAEPGPTINSL